MQMIQRSCPPVDWGLAPAEIHVWTISLDVTPASSGLFKKILSSAELERARRFRFDLHRNRFIAGRGSMRTLLSNYLQTEPSKLQIGYGPYGKPILAGTFLESGVHFNLAHSENLALLAITLAGEIGIDLEQIRPLIDADELVARFFSARESAAFHHLPVVQKPLAFFNLWTRKEAWLKATGQGIGDLLNAVEVSFLPGEPARFVSLPGDAQTLASWILREFEPAPGFVAALAISSSSPALRCSCWDEKATRETMNKKLIQLPLK